MILDIEAGRSLWVNALLRETSSNLIIISGARASEEGDLGLLLHLSGALRGSSGV